MTWTTHLRKRIGQIFTRQTSSKRGTDKSTQAPPRKTAPISVLPPGPERSAAEIDAALAEWQQGDVVPLPITAHLALPSHVVTQPHDVVGKADDDFLIVTEEVEAIVVISRTCDLIRYERNPYVEVAPLVRLPPEEATHARAHARPRYVHVPRKGPDAFADMNRCLSVEKPALVGLTPFRGCATAREASVFSEAVGRVRSRFAFPDDLSAALKSMNNRINRKRHSDTDEGRAIRELIEVIATPTPDWDASEIQVALTFITPPLIDSNLSEDEWDREVDGWIERAEAFGQIISVEGLVMPINEITLEQYRRGERLDLDRMSPEPETE